MVTFSAEYLHNFINKDQIRCFEKRIEKAHNLLHYGSDSDFKGWLNWPEEYDKNEFKSIQDEALSISNKCDIFIVIGIGGSYLGARAGIEFLHSADYNFLNSKNPKIFFVGNNISSEAINNLLEICKDKDVCLNVISKSGSTLEPALSFRIFKKFMEEKYGVEGSKSRIYCTTDKESGKLKQLANKMEYKCFVIPKNIGGRFSILTAVGLLPLAVSGADISSIMHGARDAMVKFKDCNITDNDCYRYAMFRNILYESGKKVEMIVAYNPRLSFFMQWWKQLFGESEGKNNKGIFPSSAMFSTDLHSLGQYIQEGSKILFETILNVKKLPDDAILPSDELDLDGLNYLSEVGLNYINEQAMKATLKAHTDGGTPNIVVNIDSFSEYDFGYLIYYFEKACAISAYLLGVDPFNQPGVEHYKKNMFKLLGRN